MRTIQVDEEVWEFLNRKSKVFEVSLNSVLRRILGLDKGEIEDTPRQAYRRPILRALYELGGKGNPTEILARVAEILDDILNERDRELLDSGEPRWRKAAQWVRFELVREGLLKKNSPRGVWEISEKGKLLISKQF